MRDCKARVKHVRGETAPYKAGAAQERGLGQTCKGLSSDLALLLATWFGSVDGMTSTTCKGATASP